MILVADQWNSIDNDDAASLEAKRNLKLCLGSSVVVKVYGMSMNAKTWRSTLHKQTNNVNKHYYGGLSNDEYGALLEKRGKMFQDNADELALLTGKVPLLLDVFDRVRQDSDLWEVVVEHAQQDAIIENWATLLEDFTAILTKLECGKYIPEMQTCLKIKTLWIIAFSIAIAYLSYAPRVKLLGGSCMVYGKRKLLITPYSVCGL